MNNPSTQTRIESFTDFENCIGEIKERLRTLNPTRAMLQSDPLYRGQANSEWGLRTTLERFVPDENILVNRYNSYLARARATVETVTSQKWPFSDVRELSMESFFDEPPNFEFMVYARHHGYPSPLLDWTRSPYIALYFAFANASPSQDVALFAFIKSPEGMRSASLREPQISELPHHKTTHPRHFAQQSRYTICVRNPEGPEDWEYCPHELVLITILQEQTMIPLQEISFHLSSNQVIFAHVIQQRDGAFTAEVTQAHDLGSIPSVKDFLLVACPANANAETVFRQVFSVVQSHCRNNGESTLVKVSNPCNCEFLSTQDQQRIVGQAVRVVMNEQL